jgi:outer membrane protein assembly factor BamD (BamD/ComL family)
VTPPAARQYAPQALLPSALAPVATSAPVRLELRDAKPNSLVVIDSQPKGKINRHGTFSTELVAGDHQIQWTAKNKLSGTVTRHFAGDAPVRLTSADLVPDKPSIPSAAPNTEQTEWERIKDSQTPADIEQFLARYPRTSFTSEAQAQLENLYWTNAAGSNTIGAYNQYLDRYSQGAHAQQARDNITELDWRSVETSGDATAFDAFIRKYPAGSYHDQAVNKLDDVIWQKTKQNDASSLRSYLQNFSEGHHAIEAKKRIEELTLVASTPPKTAPVAPPPLDEKKAVLDVLGRYRKAYEGHDLGQLREIWPGMSAQQVKSLGDFFTHVSGLSMEYRVLGGPSVEADHATVKFQQSLQYLVNGRPGRDSATVTMRLRKPQSTPGTWRIDSIR